MVTFMGVVVLLCVGRLPRRFISWSKAKVRLEL